MPPKKSTRAAPAITTTTGKKRGRPAKVTAGDDEPAAKRGRVAEGKASAVKTDASPDVVGPAKPPAKRGRPPKTPSVLPSANDAPRKRGRPPKTAAVLPLTHDAPRKRGRPRTNPAVLPLAHEAPRKRGRPPKATQPAKAAVAEKQSSKKSNHVAKAKESVSTVSEKQTVLPRKRGRPPKGGETTKIAVDDSAAAEQLEGDLQDSADDDMHKKDSRQSEKATTTVNTSAAAHIQAAAGVPADEVDVAASHDASHTAKQFWLMKAEQEDREEITKSGKAFNTKFTIDDLAGKEKAEAWDGVRNVVAAKNMRNMKKGDLAFFYASGGKQSRKPGITGIMEIVKEHEPDVTTADEDHYAFVEVEANRAKWCVVHVEFRKKLSKPVLLSELQQYGKDDGPLSNMVLLRLSRLSVSQVTEKEWNFICDNLIEGFEHDADVSGAVKANSEQEPIQDATDSTSTGAVSSAITGVVNRVTGALGGATSALHSVLSPREPQ